MNLFGTIWATKNNNILHCSIRQYQQQKSQTENAAPRGKKTHIFTVCGMFSRYGHERVIYGMPTNATK